MKSYNYFNYDTVIHDEDGNQKVEYLDFSNPVCVGEKVTFDGAKNYIVKSVIHVPDADTTLHLYPDNQETITLHLDDEDELISVSAMRKFLENYQVKQDDKCVHG